MKASKVNSLWISGQYDAARQAAKDAGKWSLIGAVCGIVGSIIYAVLVCMGAAIGLGL